MMCEHTYKKIILIIIGFFVMSFLTCLYLLPDKALALSETDRHTYRLAYGVTESTVYATEDKLENVRLHILRINKGANISFKIGTKKYYQKNSTQKSRKKKLKKWMRKNWGLVEVAKIAKGYERSKDRAGNVIAAVDGDYYLKDKFSGATEGNLIMEGNKVRITNRKPFFAVLKNGKTVIRGARGKTSDVREAVGGHLILVKDSKVVISKKTHHPGSPRHPNTGIGITKDGAVVLMVIDGEEPTSLGASWHELGVAMKQQGCKDAIMLDGGGSASFLTKRNGSSLKYRNTLMEGVPRNISNAILVVKNKKGNKKRVTGKKEIFMKEKNTVLKRDSKGVYSYKIKGKAKKTGFVNVNGQSYLFDKKGKGMTARVTICNTEYLYVKGELIGCSDENAEKIAVGYCGADKDGKNLIYAYHYGDKILNIGLNNIEKKSNGKMKEWKNLPNVPWGPEKCNIKIVNIGDGVKTVGKNAFQFPVTPFNDYLKKKKAGLSKVVLPESITAIKAGAFINCNNLKVLTVPKKVTSIGEKAFAYNNGATIKFTSSKPPKIGRAAFKQSRGSRKKNYLIVPDSKQWKSFLSDEGNLDRIDFTGRIKYVK